MQVLLCADRVVPYHDADLGTGDIVCQQGDQSAKDRLARGSLGEIKVDVSHSLLQSVLKIHTPPV